MGRRAGLDSIETRIGSFVPVGNLAPMPRSACSLLAMVAVLTAKVGL
jgi:hypothetical protein